MMPLRSAARLGASLAVALLAGCGTVEQIVHRPEGAPPARGQEPSAPVARPSGKLKPMPLRTFSVSTQCKFKDETGNFGSATVEVVNSKVNAFKAEVTMPKRGTCRYDLAQFRQTQALPSVELTGARDCRVHMWEQGEQITVAFANCHTLCSPASAHDYVWPLLIDKSTGRCD